MTFERYGRLNEKYLADGARLLHEEDYVQASEKFWGAVATMIKVVATRRQLRHYSHRELVGVMRMLRNETGDPEYLTLFQSAERLHANFYEDALGPEDVRTLAAEAARLVQKLQIASEEGASP